MGDEHWSIKCTEMFTPTGCKHGKSGLYSEIRLENDGEAWESVGKRLGRKMEWGKEVEGIIFLEE